MSDPRELLPEAAAYLAQAGVDNPRLDARILLAHTLGCEVNALVGGQTVSISDESRIRFLALLKRRSKREPLAYITGKKPFWNLEFAVGPGALVPRPETELLIESALGLFPDTTMPLRILDLGTGTGCILLTLLHLFPNACGTGVDCSEEALAWANRNAAALRLETRCRLIQSGWDHDSSDLFDLVVSNPPYIPTSDLATLAPELRFEPSAALDGGPDGLEAYRALAPAFAQSLVPGGSGLFEIGFGQSALVPAILAEYGLETIQIHADLAGIPRCLVARNRAPASQENRKKTVASQTWSR